METSTGGWAIFGAVAIAHALAVISPGPDFAIVTRQALTRGRAAGVLTAAGIASGILFHVGYGLFGLSWLTRREPASLKWMGLAGGLLLLWMGVSALRAPMAVAASVTEAGETRRASALRHYLLGVATNVLNPKAVVFFVALFSAVVGGALPWTLKLALAVWLPLATFGWFAAVAILLSHAGLRRALARHAHALDRAMGAILALLGAWLLACALAR
ncbi:MAG: LysE family transporter [Sinobacteraceae bacterium]|nr:LysE family transporter [Nevskiaceae bacterium]